MACSERSKCSDLMGSKTFLPRFTGSFNDHRRGFAVLLFEGADVRLAPWTQIVFDRGHLSPASEI